jgi:hypothetical protein
MSMAAMSRYSRSLSIMTTLGREFKSGHPHHEAIARPINHAHVPTTSAGRPRITQTSFLPASDRSLS